MIFKIARTELRNLFYSPVAWFLLIAFFVQCAIFYMIPLMGVARYQDILLENVPKFKAFPVSLTVQQFLQGDGIFVSVLRNLYLFVPLLTMGLINREKNNGTIKLLYSSPVNVRQIVLGKYLAVMLYNLLLVLVVGIFVITGIFNIKLADYGLLLSAILGFFLLVSAFSAIGMFMSSLTTYQIVSAIGCFLVIFMLSRIGTLWQEYDLVRDITYYLSMNGRTFKMLQGLITTNDVLYFVVIVYMFIGFTIIRLKGAREHKPWFVNAGRYVLVTISAILVGYCTSRPGYIGYWDTTRDKLNTVHEKTQQIIREMGDDPIEVTMYTNLLENGLKKGLPAARNNYIWEMWEKYMRFKPNINLKYVYYYDQDEGEDSISLRPYPGKNFDEFAALVARNYDVDISLFLKREEIRKQIDLEDENYNLVMKVDFKGRTMFLRTFNDPLFWPDEEMVAATFRRLSTSYTPSIYYVTGDWERSIYKNGEREFSLHATNKKNRWALINHGFEPDTLSLDHQDIPSNATTLVLADPRSDLSEVALGKIHRYLNNGGNMFILGEYGKQHVVNPVLQPLGVQLMKGTLVEITKDEMPHKVVSYLTDTALELAGENAFRLYKLSKEGPTPDTLKEYFKGSVGISFSDSSSFAMTPLMTTVTHRNTWVRVGKLVTDSAAPVFTPAEGDYKQPVFNTVVALSRQVHDKEQRIVVSGDADFMSNNQSGGGAISRGIFSWLDNNVYPKYIPKSQPLDNLLNLSYAGARIQKILFIWVIPGLILLAATVLLIRRKRQ